MPPVVEAERVYTGGAQTATIEADVQPSDLETRCRVQYIEEQEFAATGWADASASQGHEEACPHSIAGTNRVQAIQVQLTGLRVATAYRYRVVAENAAGQMLAPGAMFSTFGIESFAFQAVGEKGEPFVQAGGHPYELITSIAFNTTHEEDPQARRNEAPSMQDGVVRDIEFELPAGLVGNPDALPKCKVVELEAKTCDPASQLGVIEVDEQGYAVHQAGLFNLVSPRGTAARFGARINAVANATIEAGVRSGGDYGVDADSLAITSLGNVTGVTVRMWGVPGSPAHTQQRYCGTGRSVDVGTCPPKGQPATAEGPEVPFLSMPTSCGVGAGTVLAADSYQAIGVFAGAFEPMPRLDGCERISFSPLVDAGVTSSRADSPTGLEFHLHLPQHDELGKPYEAVQGQRTADLRSATVTLPAGMTVNPSSAAGLSGCSPAQISPGGSAQHGTEITADEEQRIEVEPRTDASFTVAFEGHETGPLPANATPTQVEGALQALPGIGVGNIHVGGGNGGPFLVRFEGMLANRSVAPLATTVVARAIQHVTLRVGGKGSKEYANDSFQMVYGGQTTGAKFTATAHLGAEAEETHGVGYIEDAGLSGLRGSLVTGEAITGPGLPAGTRVKLAPGRVELINTSGAPASYVPGTVTGAFETSLPSEAFAETIQEALEALPGMGAVRVTGGPEGNIGLPEVTSTYTVAFERPEVGVETHAFGVVPVIEEVPQTVTQDSEESSTQTEEATVVQRGGVPHLNAAPAQCPPASKIGTVEIKTPLLEHALPGAVYLATPYENPFDSLIALYIAVHDPISGVVVKLAGRVEANPANGQITATFDENPQLPFEDLALKFREGPRAPLATPRDCGRYTTTSLLEPWSHLATGEAGTPDASPTSQFEITSSPSGSCAGPGFAPSLAAGTTSNGAASFSPLIARLQRNDGEQAFKSVSLTLPNGLTGEIANVPRCGEAQADAGVCPASTQIGHVDVQAGVGGDPLTLPEAGRQEDPVYLTGPFEGAPFGLAIVVHAEAGPFNLGTVVVRARIEVNPHTAQVTAATPASGPYAMPTFLKGIPVDLRTIQVTINRPYFILNPTSCEAMSVTGAIGAAEGATAGVASRFEAAGCRQLAFAPKLTAWTQAKNSRKDGASLAVRVRYPHSGEANIAKVKVQLPKKLPTRQETLKQACTEAQFAANPAGCPEGSRVGTATAVTPILASPLTGPVYFVSHAAAKFPELIAVLQGEGVTIELNGETYISSKGITTSTFATVPDEPISSFTMSFPEGPYSAVSAVGANLCRDKLLMPTTITGQNGAVIDQTTHIAVRGCSGRVALASHKVKRHNLKLEIYAPAQGKVKAFGAGLTTKTKSVKGRRMVLVVLKSRGHRCNKKTHVTVIFKPRHGKHQKRVYKVPYPRPRRQKQWCVARRLPKRHHAKGRHQR